MDILTLLRSLEGAIYELGAWIMLIPKTFLRFTFHPAWAITYVNEEWQKKPEDRFDEYLSPLLLWIFVGVVPSVIFANQVEYMSGVLQPFPNSHLGAWLNKLTEPEKFTINIVIALIAPILFAGIMEWFNKQPLKRSTAGRIINLQCCVLTPIQFTLNLFIVSFTLMEYLMMALQDPPWLRFVHSSHILITYACIALLTFFYETFLFHSELKGSWRQALGYSIIAFLIFGLAQFVIFLISFLYTLFDLLSTM
jgi:hypothetical protein